MLKRKIQFRFYNNSKRQPVVTACVIKELNGDKAIGVAVYWNSDPFPFNGKRGKKIALGRAFKALRNRSSSSDIRRPGIMEIVRPCVPTLYKCLFVPNDY